MLDLYTVWGRSGAALLITGNTPVDRMHLEHAGNVVLDAQADVPKMAALAAAAQCGGARILAQIAHTGRQTPAAINPHPISVSDIPVDLPGYGDPRAATDEDFAAIIHQFTIAAEQAQAAGFDGVEEIESTQPCRRAGCWSVGL